MKKKTLLTLLLSSLSLFALVLGTHTKVAQGVNALVQENHDKFSSENVRIMVAPDGIKGSDWWNQASAITAIAVLHTSDIDEVENYRVKRLVDYDNTESNPDGDNEKRTIVWYNLDFTPGTGSYAGRKLWFFNVNYNLIKGRYFQILRLTDASTSDLYKANHITAPILFTDDLITKIWKVERNESGGPEYSPHSFSTSGGSFTGQVLVHVIEAYLTCSPSAVNGYMAYGGLQTTYNYNGRTTSTLAMKDFVDPSEYETGRLTDDGASTTLGAKVTKMKALYEAAQGTIATPNNTTNYLNVIIVISVLGLSTLFAFYFLKKKPQNI